MKIDARNRKLEVGRWKTGVLFILGLVTFFSIDSVAQSEERKLIRDGNKLYKEKKFSDAEVNYKKAMGINKSSVPGNYNLGNAYYKQGKFDEASQQYQSIISNKDLGDDQKSRAFHNIGNSLLESKKYPESIEAFKNSLKLNPKDNDTRYNLAYAQSMLQQQQQQQQKQDKNDKNKDQKNKDQQNKKEDKKKEEQKKDQQNKDQKENKEDQKQAEQKKKDISKEDAEKILQALNNDEKNTQKKLIKKESTRMSIEKTW